MVPLATGLAWGNGNGEFLYFEKLDGKFALHDVIAYGNNNILAGEHMIDGRFIVWDCICYFSEDVRSLPLLTRLDMMLELCRIYGLQSVQSSNDGGTLLRNILASGGEGIVRKSLSATYWQPMTACKRSMIYACRVVGIGLGQSVTIVDAETGQDRGSVAMRGGKCDQVRVGSLIRVDAMQEYASGKLRQPNPCSDWLVTY